MRYHSLVMFENLEKTILRYRTNEMMRILFHIEDLRKFLVDSMKSSNIFINESDHRFFNEKSKVMPQIWRRAIDDKILTKDEVEDLKNIIKKRNDIAHEIHKFTLDLHSELKQYMENSHFQTEYDYGALERLLEYKSRLQNKWQGTLVISFRSIQFDFADKFYEEENVKLNKRIDRLYKERAELITLVNKELASFTCDSYDDYPKNSANYKENGYLSTRGVKTCMDLLNKGLSCYAVSILMDISLDKVKYHNRKHVKCT